MQLAQVLKVVEGDIITDKEKIASKYKYVLNSEEKRRTDECK